MKEIKKKNCVITSSRGEKAVGKEIRIAIRKIVNL